MNPFPDNVKLALALPHTLSVIPTATHHSLFCVARPDQMHYITANAGGDLANRREYQIETALKLGCTHLWMVDGDMVFPPDILIRLFKLLEDGADLAGGLCYRGYPPYEPIAAQATQTGNMLPGLDFEFGDVIEAAGTGTACLLVTREVFEKVPRPWFSILRDEEKGLRVVRSLDMYFTRRATALGFRLKIETERDVHHLREIGVGRDFYFMNSVFEKITARKDGAAMVQKFSEKINDPRWAMKFEALLNDGHPDPSTDPAVENWTIISGNDSLFARRLAKILNLKICSAPGWSHDGLFFVDMLPENFLSARRARTTPKICYWTGTDAARFLAADRKIDFGNAIHVTDSPWLAISLQHRLPNICFLPMPPALESLDVPVDPGPASPGILMYLNQHIMRDIERSVEFIKCIRDIPIYVMRGPGERVKLPEQENVTELEFFPEEKKEEIFRKVAVHIRFMKHDGLSQTVVEMKMLGRHVFYTTRMPSCHLITPDVPVEAVAERAREALNQPLDLEGAKWYRETFTVENFKKILGELCRMRQWPNPWRIE